jgi:predicted nucleic acid-binding protein
MVCDSNNLIYAAEPGDTVCLPFVERPDAMIASVTRIEVLGFPRFGLLAPEQQALLQALVTATVEASLDDDVIRRAIALRQQKKMTLADAVIAATALEYDVPLVTRNEDDFKHIADLALVNRFAPAP